MRHPRYEQIEENVVHHYRPSLLRSNEHSAFRSLSLSLVLIQFDMRCWMSLIACCQLLLLCMGMSCERWSMIDLTWPFPQYSSSSSSSSFHSLHISTHTVYSTEHPCMSRITFDAYLPSSLDQHTHIHTINLWFCTLVIQSDFFLLIFIVGLDE